MADYSELSSHKMPQIHSKLKEKYTTGQIHATRPVDTLLALYASSRKSARETDTVRLLHHLRLLRDSLDFSQSQEIALGLSQIYTYCEAATREGGFQQVHRILAELEQYWKRASIEAAV